MGKCWICRRKFSGSAFPFKIPKVIADDIAKQLHENDESTGDYIGPTGDLYVCWFCGHLIRNISLGRKAHSPIV